MEFVAAAFAEPPDVNVVPAAFVAVEALAAFVVVDNPFTSVVIGAPEAVVAPAASVVGGVTCPTTFVPIGGCPGATAVAGLIADAAFAAGELVAGSPGGPGGLTVESPGGAAVVGAPCTCADAKPPDASAIAKITALKINF